MARVGVFTFLLLIVCLAASLAQESAESTEAGQGGGGESTEAGQGGGGGQAGQGGGPIEGAGPIFPGGPQNDFNPHGLTGRRLRIFNARLNFVRRELSVIAQAITRFLFFGREEAAILREELLLALEVALFSPPEDPNDQFPPLDGGIPL